MKSLKKKKKNPGDEFIELKERLRPLTGQLAVVNVLQRIDFRGQGPVEA